MGASNMSIRHVISGLIAAVIVICGCESEAGCASINCLDYPAPPCAGYDPGQFCNDCNPCTADINCIPCEDVAEPSQYTCGGYRVPPTPGHDLLDARCDNVPPVCWHIPFSTKDEPGAGCFPIAVPDDDHVDTTGRCCAGTCIYWDGYCFADSLPAVQPLL